MPPARLGILYSADGVARLARLVGPAIAKELVDGALPAEVAELGRTVWASEDTGESGLFARSARHGFEGDKVLVRQSGQEERCRTRP